MHLLKFSYSKISNIEKGNLVDSQIFFVRLQVPIDEFSYNGTRLDEIKAVPLEQIKFITLVLPTKRNWLKCLIHFFTTVEKGNDMEQLLEIQGVEDNLELQRISNDEIRISSDAISLSIEGLVECENDLEEAVIYDYDTCNLEVDFSTIIEKIKLIEFITNDHSLFYIYELKNPFKDNDFLYKDKIDKLYQYAEKLKKILEDNNCDSFDSFNKCFLELERRGFVSTNFEFEELINKNLDYKGFFALKFTKDQVDDQGNNNPDKTPWMLAGIATILGIVFAIVLYRFYKKRKI